MKTLVLIDAVHTLISRDRIDLALALLRKLLKQVEPDMYRQVVQLSWRFNHLRTQEMEGQMSPEEAIHQRNLLAHNLLSLTESMYRQLPEFLNEGASDTANALLHAIADIIKPTPEDLRLIGNAPEDKEKPPRGSTAVGMVLLLLSAFAMLGGMMRAERTAFSDQQHLVYALAEAHGLTALDGGYAHLNLDEDDLQLWIDNNRFSVSVEEIKSDFAALLTTLKEAEEEGREIFNHMDWFALSGISRGPDYHLATQRPERQHRADQSGWRVVEF